MTIKSTTNCPTCLSEVNVHGKTSHFYYPKFTQEMFDKKDKQIAKLKEQIAELKEQLNELLKIDSQKIIDLAKINGTIHNK